MTNLVEYRVIENVAEIVMNRPPVNAINHQLTREVVDAYKRARFDDSARAVILTSALPTVFSAGLDLNSPSKSMVRPYAVLWKSFITKCTRRCIGWVSRLSLRLTAMLALPA